MTSGALLNNQSVAVTLVFSNPGNVVINYIPQVLSNPLTLEAGHELPEVTVAMLAAVDGEEGRRSTR